MIRPCRCVSFCKPLPRPHMSVKKVFHSILWTAWHKSKVQVGSGRHQRSNNRLFGFLATHRRSYVFSWSRQSIAVTLVMIPPQAHRAELLVRRDDDKCNSLRSTKNRFELLCHPSLCLSAETRPTLLEDHLWDLRLFWLIPYKGGFSDTLISSKQFCCSTCDWEYEVSTFFGR